MAHKRLLHKISAFGIHGSVLSWIQDFFTGCWQYVSVIKGGSSSWKDVLSGVPQGSILGPILFILYINDLPEVVNSIVKIFGDETKIYNKDSNNDIIQQYLDALCTWAQIWQLRFNVKKCKNVHYGKTNQFYQYTINFEDIETASEEKDLGVTFQRDLKFSRHIDEKINQANSTLSLIVRNLIILSKTPLFSYTNPFLGHMWNMETQYGIPSSGKTSKV